MLAHALSFSLLIPLFVPHKDAANGSDSHWIVGEPAGGDEVGGGEERVSRVTVRVVVTVQTSEGVLDSLVEC